MNDGSMDEPTHMFNIWLNHAELVGLDAWIEIHTPKQALFFWPLVNLLRDRGIEVLVTSRRYEQLDWILKLLGIDAMVVGRFGGGDLLGKLRASSERQLRLVSLVERARPRLGISSGSIEMCRICFGMGVGHILVSDSPHSVVNRLSAPLSDKVLTPYAVGIEEWGRYGIPRRRIKRYRALDPVAWIRRQRIGAKRSREFILVRSPESKASYMLGRGVEESIRVIETSHELTGMEVVVLTRYADEARILKGRLRAPAKLITKPTLALPLIQRSALVLCGGGTIAQEAALLGKPTILFYPGEPPAVHRFLERKGLLKIVPPSRLNTLGSVIEEVMEPDRVRRVELAASRLLSGMEDPVRFVYREVMEYL